MSWNPDHVGEASDKMSRRGHGCTSNDGVVQGTVLMALLQPAPEVYELFDDIMLLCEGNAQVL